MKTGIINYNTGNCGSINNIIKKVGGHAKIIDHPDELNDVSKIILPGVGAFDYGMQELRKAGWIEILNKKVLEEKMPILGICLGMQLMTNKSEEGTLSGLGWIDADVKKFSFTSPDIKVPHIGWNYVQPQNMNNLFKGFQEIPRFYFVHSYYVSCARVENILSYTEYHTIRFVSSFQKDNIWGVQFHPEKSHVFGMQLIKNFLSI